MQSKVKNHNNTTIRTLLTSQEPLYLPSHGLKCELWQFQDILEMPLVMWLAPLQCILCRAW